MPKLSFDRFPTWTVSFVNTVAMTDQATYDVIKQCMRAGGIAQRLSTCLSCSKPWLQSPEREREGLTASESSDVVNKQHVRRTCWTGSQNPVW